MKNFLPIALTGAATLLLAACADLSPMLGGGSKLSLTDHPLAGAVVNANGKPASEAAVVAAARRADVVILGETHDNPLHHEIQSRVLKAMIADGKRMAVVFEQVNRNRQSDIDRALQPRQKIDRVEAIGATFAPGWDWPEYKPLVAQAVEAGLPVVAGNLDREALRPLVKDGWDSIAEGIRNHLAIDAAWNEEREAYLTKVIEESHCNAIDESLRDGLVRAQRLRDATLADAILSARGPERRQVVLIAGRGHARSDAGVPRYLEARDPKLKILSLGITEVEAGEVQVARYLADRADGKPHDYLWLTPRFDRPDPCAELAKRTR